MLAAAFAGMAVLTPWIARNYLTFHRFIPVRSGYGLELYIGNNGYSTRWVNSALHPNHNDAELSEYERVGEIAYMDHKAQQAKAYKPDTKPFQVALKKLGFHPAEVLHVAFGYRYDLGPAREMGMRTAWLNRGSENLPEGFAADFEVSGMDQLVTLATKAC